jgi:adenine-specific DNA methylase
LLRRRTADGLRWVPRRAIPTEGRADDRLLDYGYRYYHNLFNPRQLLHLSVLAEALAKTEARERDALGLAFSDHLTTNCMQTQYAFGWRRLAPLFSIRAYRHVTRPVEINPWLDGTGRGTFPNTVRQVQRAIEFARNPTVARLDGGFVRSGSLDTNGRSRVILNADSRHLAGVTGGSVDLILTDPPFFDNIAYAELSDFFLPWLEAQGLVAPSGEGPASLPPNLASRTRDGEGYDAFRQGLADCFIQMRRVLKDDGRLVFSYQHRTPEGWDALAFALARGGWHPVQVFPMLGNSSSGLHRHEGTIMWDAVTVCRKGRVRAVDRLSAGARPAADAVAHARSWAARLDSVKGTPFREADRANLQSAALVAATLGIFGDDDRSGSRPLRELLSEVGQEEG